MRKRLPTILLLALSLFARAEGPKPLDQFPFPDRLSACVWRNWGLVPSERLAATLGATADEITALAGEMGLKPDPAVLPAWRRKGYITIVRRNWHLLPEEQILQLIDMDAQEFAYRLKEDDFLWHKLGFLKPDCGPLKYTAAEAAAGRAARKRLVEILKGENVDPDAAEEPRFAFVDELKSLDALRPSRPSHPSPFTFRMISSYFADYGDPLVDDEIGSFPEGLLQKLADEGVNAVWMHVVLNTLVKDARYPEFGSGSERRIANLKKLVARAQKHGIKVYLYLNEPRCLSTAFFEKEGRAAIRGAVEAKKGVAALCTSVPEVRRWLRDSLTALFSEVKGLGGVFTITMSENLTNCASHSRRETCPRCKGRSVAEILAEVNRTVAEGVAAGDPSAEAIVWNWGWPKGVEKDVFPKLPKGNCRVMHVSENGIPVTVGGVTVPEHDYSIAIVGPGENAKSFWRTARSNGLPVLAKVQACNSWELSSFSFIPALDLVAEQAANLTREGVEGVMLSWSCGSAPAMNLRVYGGESLDEIAADVYGAAAAPFVRRAWTAYSEGFRRYPFDIVTVYKGPMQWGPANPLYPKPTGYQATMVGFPYDALRFGTWDNQWHGRFPVEAWIARFDEVAKGFAEGNRLFAEALAHVEPAKRAAAERDLAMFRAEEMHFRSTVDQSRFILARDAGNTSEIRRLALKELATAKAYLPLVRADSRIGYECSNHYYYVPRDVVEKILACRLIADAAKPRTTRQSLRETSWLWGHETGQVDGPKNNWGLAPATNDYPMVEAAKLLGLESLNVIRWDCPDKAFRDTLRGLKRVTWPMCGIPKAGVEASFDALCEWNFRVAEEMPNVTGFDLDDFFRPDKKRREFFVETPSGRRRACPTSFPYEKLVALRKRLDAFPRPLELRTVVYDDLFHQCLSPEDLLPLLELTDVVTYWTWKAASTDRLEENFATLRRLVPTRRIQLGIYLYDFGGKKEMDVRCLERQLAFGLARWRRGEIEGFVFLCSSLCNRDTPAVRFVRDWLKQHGDETRMCRFDDGKGGYDIVE